MKEIDLIMDSSLSLESFLLYFKLKNGDLSKLIPFVPKISWEEVSDKIASRERDVCFLNVLEEVFEELSPEYLLTLVMSGIPSPLLKQKLLERKDLDLVKYADFLMKEDLQLFLLKQEFDVLKFTQYYDQSYFSNKYSKDSESIFVENEDLQIFFSYNFLKNVRTLVKDFNFNLTTTIGSFIFEEMMHDSNYFKDKKKELLFLKEDLHFWSKISYIDENVLENILDELI